MGRGLGRRRMTKGQRALIAGLVLCGQSFRDSCFIANVDHRFVLQGYMRADWAGPKRRQTRWIGKVLADIRSDWLNPKLRMADIERRNGVARCTVHCLARQHRWPDIARRSGRSGPHALSPARYAYYQKLRETMPWREALNVAWASAEPSLSGAMPPIKSAAAEYSPSSAGAATESPLSSVAA